MGDNNITKTADIHIRCYPDDKENVIERAKDGFGKDNNSITNLVLYALRHVDDTSPIVLSHVDSLIRTISENRQTIVAVHGDIQGISGELNSIGVNVNQIAKSINTTLKIARKSNYDDFRQDIPKILFFQGEIDNSILKLNKIMEKYDQKIQSARTILNSCLRKEDELLTKTLVHPRVGKIQLLEAQLLRLLEEYMGDNQECFSNMCVGDLFFQLHDKVKKSLDANKPNNERR